MWTQNWMKGNLHFPKCYRQYTDVTIHYGRAEGMIKKLEKNVNTLIQESVLAGSAGDHQTVSATLTTHP